MATTVMASKHNLGQYFTTHNELKEKVFEFIINNPFNILEPSIGQGASTVERMSYKYLLNIINL